MSGRQLTEGFRDIIELKWSEFVALEQDEEQTNFTSILATLVRACTKGNLRAIQTALDRLDGRISMEIEVEYPKFYTVYPQATRTIDESTTIDLDKLGEIVLPVPLPDHITFESTPPEEPPTGSLRATLERMLEAPKKTVFNILATIEAVESGDMSHGNPQVKSVVTAGLMKLVHDGRVGAVLEVFDQIDGKVADKIKLLGGDVYMTSYADIAPEGAEKNEEGVYQVSADNVTNAWAARLDIKQR